MKERCSFVILSHFLDYLIQQHLGEDQHHGEADQNGGTCLSEMSLSQYVEISRSNRPQRGPTFVDLTHLKSF